MGDYQDVATAWINKNPDAYLEGGRKVIKIKAKHPVSDNVLRSFLK